MQSKTFGRSDERVSALGHGTWGMGGMWGPRDDRAAIDALVYALQNGINFLDTARVYGNGHSEGLIASALKESKEQAFVATKVPPKNHRWPASHQVSVQDVFPKQWILEQTEQSLKSLRQDHVDLQQLHVWSDSWCQDLSFLEAIRILKEQGKLRFFGVSINDHQPESALQIVKSGLLDSVQVIFNIFDQSPLDQLFALCEEHAVSVIVRCPFDEGALTGKLNATTRFHKKDWRSHYFTPERLQQVEARVEALTKLLPADCESVAELALRYCLSFPAVTTVIPGMRTTQNVERNLKAIKKGPLPAPLVQELSQHRWQRNFYPFQ